MCLLCDLSRPYAAACSLPPRGMYQSCFKKNVLSILYSRHERVIRCVCVILAGPMLQHASCFPEGHIKLFSKIIYYQYFILGIKGLRDVFV